MAIRATPLLKVNIFFGILDRGWTDTYYLPGSTIDVNAETKVGSLVARRLALTSTGVRCEGVRISVEGIFRDSRFYGPGSLIRDYVIPQTGTYTVEQSMEPSQGLMVRLEAGALHRRMFIMRGLPETIVGTDNLYHTTATFNDRLNRFIDRLVNDGWVLRTLDKSQPAFRIISGSFVADDVYTWHFRTAGAIQVLVDDQAPNPVMRNAAPGDHIIVPRMTGTRNFGKIWRIAQAIGPDNNLAWTYYMGPDRSPTVFPTPFYVNFITMTPAIIQGVGIDRFTTLDIRSHRTGRPFDVPRGRRSPR